MGGIALTPRTRQKGRVVQSEHSVLAGEETSDLSCRSCMFGEIEVRTKAGPVRVCRRYPPAIFHDESEGGPKIAFPNVDDGDWCGEWSEA